MERSEYVIEPFQTEQTLLPSYKVVHCAAFPQRPARTVSDKLSLVELRGKTVRVVGLKQRVS